MYHPGKVIEVLRPTDKQIHAADATAQATLRMWDENILTLMVSPKLASKISPGQMVLVDYRPAPEHHQPVPVHIIIKIIEGKKAETIWAAYREMYERQRRAQASQAQSYIG